MGRDRCGGYSYRGSIDYDPDVAQGKRVRFGELRAGWAGRVGTP